MSGESERPRRAGRRPTRVAVGEVWSVGWHTWWTNATEVILLGIVVFVPATLVENLATVRFDEATSDGVLDVAVVVVAVMAASANTLALLFYSGLVDSVVGVHQHGHQRHGYLRLARRLPYGKLLGAQVLSALLVVAGFVLLIIPGLVVFTLLCIAGPVTILERRGPVAALRRSARLVRPVFWVALVAVTLPVQVEHALEEAVHALPFVHGFWSELATETLMAVVVGSFVGVIEATLAHELMARDREGVAVDAVAAP